MSTPPPESFIPLRGVELHVLLGVAKAAQHGYAILQEADARTGGRPGFEIPTLYRALRRMRDAGLIRATPAPDGESDPRREYWVATDLGREVLAAEVRRLQVLVAEGVARVGAQPLRGTR